MKEENERLRMDNDDLREKYMRMVTSHDVTFIIQECIQNKEKTISELKRRVTELELAVM